MYMSRVMLKRVPSPDVVHRVIAGAFQGKRSEEANEYPWRIDRLGDSSALIIVSADIPEIGHIIREIGVDDARNKTLDYAPFLERIESGKNWRFRICANPVEHKKSAAVSRGKVYALRFVPEQLAWLDRQGVKHGFVVKGCDVIGDEWRIISKKETNNDKNTVRIRAITFDGILTITGTEAFREALTKGIGRGKAYGCGLLTIAGAQT